MRPAHLLLAVAGLATFGIAGSGLAFGITWLRIDHVEQRLAAEFSELDSGGVLREPRAQESQELEKARGELARLLAHVQGEEYESPPFATPAWVQRHSLDELDRELERRADWYDAVDALPASLWGAAGEPRASEGRERASDTARRPSDSLMGLRSATNHLCAKAWHLAHDPDRTAEAGRWLARAAALARITDSGSSFDLMLRIALESIVIGSAERTAEIPGVDAALLLTGLREELGRRIERDRLAQVLHSDLRWLEYQYEEYRTGDPGASRLRAQERILERVRAWRSLLRTDLATGLPEFVARLEDHSPYDPRRHDYLAFSAWQSRQTRVAAFLADT